MGALHYSASSVFGRSAWRPVCVCVYSEGGGGGGGIGDSLTVGWWGGLKEQMFKLYCAIKHDYGQFSTDFIQSTQK